MQHLTIMAATPAKQAGSRPPRIWRRSSVRYLAGFCILAVAAYIFLALFQPGLQYKISQPPAGALDSENFRHELEALVEAKFNANTSVEVIANGENFYAAELAAIRAAQHNINLEAYIFHRGKITDQVIAALTERARAGVRVNLNLDALGSLTMPKYRFRELRQAGGNVQWYHQMRWYSWPRYNNRTHRELTVIDGRDAFLGGAGFPTIGSTARAASRAGATPCFACAATPLPACKGRSWKTGCSRRMSCSPAKIIFPSRRAAEKLSPWW